MTDRRRTLPTRQITVWLARENGMLSREYAVPSGDFQESNTQALAEIGASFKDGRGVRGVDALHGLLMRANPNELGRKLSGGALDRAGRLLFEILFGTTPAATQRVMNGIYGKPGKMPGWEPVRVRIVTQDPVLMALPWMATAFAPAAEAGQHWSGILLVDRDWTFEVCFDASDLLHVTHTSPGSMLIIAPERADEAKPPGIETPAHLDSLKEILNGVHPGWTTLPDNFEVVTTLAEVEGAVDRMRPEIVYFYGHGEVVNGRAHLRIADPPRERALLRDVTNVMKCLRARPPHAVLINACSVGQAGFQSVGFDLGSRFPIVIAHATKARADVARAFACTWLTQWLHGGADPIVAAHNRIPGPSHKLDDWATPYVCAHYATFTTKVPRSSDRRALEDPEAWLDRARQRKDAMDFVRRLLRHKTQRLQAIVATGRPDNHTDWVGRQLRDFVMREAKDILLSQPCRLAFPIFSAATTFKRELERGLLNLPKLPGSSPRPFTDVEDVLHELAPEHGGEGRVVWLDWGALRGQVNFRAPLDAWLLFLLELAPRVPESISVVATLTIEAEGDTLELVRRDLSSLRSQKEFWSATFRCAGMDELHDPTLDEVTEYLDEHDCYEGILHDLAGRILQRSAERAQEGKRYKEIVALLRHGRELGSWHALLADLGA